MKQSFFEKITGTISLKGRSSDFEEEVIVEQPKQESFGQWETDEKKPMASWL